MARPTDPDDPARTEEGMIPDSERPQATRSADIGGGSSGAGAVEPPRTRGATKGLVFAVIAVAAIILLLLLF